MDSLNILHWLLFFDQDTILNEILNHRDDSEDKTNLAMALAGDHFELEYET